MSKEPQIEQFDEILVDEYELEDWGLDVLQMSIDYLRAGKTEEAIRYHMLQICPYHLDHTLERQWSLGEEVQSVEKLQGFASTHRYMCSRGLWPYARMLVIFGVEAEDDAQKLCLLGILENWRMEKIYRVPCYKDPSGWIVGSIGELPNRLGLGHTILRWFRPDLLAEEMKEMEMR